MLGKFLEGAAWFATLSLATAGGLTFVPDAAWETFPTALRPARAKLAEFGVAPTRYRADFDAEKNAVLASDSAATQGATGDQVDGNAADAGQEDAWLASTRVRIGERWQRVREVDETTFVNNWNDDVATEGALGSRAQNRNLEPETTANPEIASVAEIAGATDGGEDLAASDVASGNAEADGVESSAGPVAVDETWENDAIPPFVEELSVPAVAEGGETGVANGENGAPAPFPVVENLDALDGGADDVLNVESATAENAPVAPSADVANGSANGLNAVADVNPTSSLLEQADAAIPNDLSVETPPVAPAAPVDEAAELRAALAAALTASTPEEIKTVFETLNRIRNERGARLGAEDAKALDAALDRLAFDVFYNPAQAILEPRWQTAPGESLLSIAERLGTTPETLAEINGLKKPVDEPLPVGTTLKTVRGPVSAEISIAKKELTLRFNGLYAGRFALGVPESSANLRGDFRVVEKLANPNCDAVDANGQTIAIPGGAPENPLGVAWIALDGGVGLQGTNRPELVGQTIPENGGFVFSNREIAQLSVLLPVGAVVAVVD
ncbi:MAG: LysM peptidoglycan-binding domain-containing protein [Thermoguttaceae bacterium]|nr:LysM peptidoglycan-binding domain-containing protein [Thermoguttaceae bacterium]